MVMIMMRKYKAGYLIQGNSMFQKLLFQCEERSDKPAIYKNDVSTIPKNSWINRMRRIAKLHGD